MIIKVAPPSVIINLSNDELKFPTERGRKRQSEAERLGCKDLFGFEGDGEEIHILGARGEAAFAKGVGVVWEGTINTFRRGADVLIYQVRTRSEHWYDLIVREEDKPQEKYVLVTSDDRNEYILRGWKKGEDARRDEWKQTYGSRPPAWFVPQTHLEDIRALISSRKTRVVPTAPSLLEWARKYGGYWNIPWAEWDAANREFQMKLRYGDSDA